MKKFLFAAAVVATVAVTSAGFFNATARAAGEVPCEQMLKDVRSAIETAKLTDVDKAKVAELEAKGVERCNADDDQRADGFFAEALKIMGK
ncbi:MAG: hypothetical protein IH582_03700 [Afipia sp.]|nr:hypothetical protein [Afipia sp.]